MSEVTRIGLIAAVLESIVFLDSRRIDEMHFEARFLQPVDKPVPVEGGFDHDASQLGSPWRKERKDFWQVVRHALFRDHPVRLIGHGHDAVIRMQVNSAIFHHSLPSVQAVGKLTLTPPPP
jgi:hypothetical protein